MKDPAEGGKYRAIALVAHEAKFFFKFVVRRLTTDCEGKRIPAEEQGGVCPQQSNLQLAGACKRTKDPPLQYHLNINTAATYQEIKKCPMLGLGPKVRHS